MRLKPRAKAKGSIVAEVASKIARQHGKLSDADVEAARAAGLSDGKIVEIIAVVALLTFTNYLNNVAGDRRRFPAGRGLRV